MISLGYEHFRDNRVADRGLPSFAGRPADLDISTYIGNPVDSHVRARVNLGSASIEHQAGSLNIENRFSIGDYDRGYQNFVPGTINAGKTSRGTQCARGPSVIRPPSRPRQWQRSALSLRPAAR